MNSLTLSCAQVDNKPHFDLPVIQKAATAPDGVVGNSYRHYFKDLSKPETLPQRNTEKPADESDRAKIIFENFQELARA